MQLYSAYGASRELEKDRQTIVRALRDVPPDGLEGDQPRWKLATIVKALETSRGGGGSKSQEAGLTEARAELTREQTAAVALKNAISRGEYVSLSVVQRQAETIFVTFRERCLAIPGKIASACEMRSRGEVEEIIRSELYEALDELSRPILPDDGGMASLGGDVGESADGSEGTA